MFRCHFCKNNIGPGIPTTKVTVETRKKIYPKKERMIEGKLTMLVAEKEGSEIVKEVNACPTCA